MKTQKRPWPIACVLLPLTGFAQAADIPVTTADDTLAVPGFALPASNFLSPDARRIKAQPDVWSAVRQCTRQRIDSAHLEAKDKLEAMLDSERKFGQCADELYFAPLLQKQQQTFAAETRTRTIAGVKVEEFTPRDGIAPANRNRVLLNLHGGGFKSGSGIGGRVESLPIATQGRIRVISVDYRQGPEYRFPAASEDVVAVYRELLKDYDALDIGIYGCSAGGTLTGQVLRKLIVDGLPTPGAAGMFCAAPISPIQP
jgi:acetyl esterase/lipase